ncbi:MAG: amidohydrolase family protein [Nocardia sp.]|nr:amidohydrolase family protein [Nocardia sp.]
MTNPESVRIFDADNHYYEPFEAISSRIDPEMRKRVIDCAVIDGKKRHILGGKVDYSVANPGFDPIAKPGALYEWFRGNPRGLPVQDYLVDREPIPDYYHHPEPRVKLMDEQGLDQVWLFPTSTVLYEEPLKHDPEAVALLAEAFNAWLLEDWTFNYRNRIFAAPYVSLALVDRAAKTVEWAAEHGATTLVMPPRSVLTPDGYRRPADPVFDPFWAKVAETGVTIVIHAGNSGYSFNGYADGRVGSSHGEQSRFASDVQIWRGLTQDRPIFDIMASFMYDRLFERFPTVRIASVENGCKFLPDLFLKAGMMKNKLPNRFEEDPIELFKNNVWVNPFWEDELSELVDLIGGDRVLFGSDWPHIEGLPNPADYLVETKDLDETTRAQVMGGNTRELNTPRPA